ncbi:MAG: lyase family protein [Solirubrobacteraceae bacterium]
MSRFSEPQDPVFARLNASLAFDRRLWHHDIAQSRAHARMLAAQSIIGEDDRDALLAALDAAERELADGAFPFADEDEDIHMAVERRVTEIAGPVGSGSSCPSIQARMPSPYEYGVAGFGAPDRIGYGSHAHQGQPGVAGGRSSVGRAQPCQG